MWTRCAQLGEIQVKWGVNTLSSLRYGHSKVGCQVKSGVNALCSAVRNSQKSAPYYLGYVPDMVPGLQRGWIRHITPHNFRGPSSAIQPCTNEIILKFISHIFIEWQYLLNYNLLQPCKRARKKNKGQMRTWAQTASTPLHAHGSEWKINEWKILNHNETYLAFPHFLSVSCSAR